MNNELSKLNDDYQKGSNSIEELKKKLEDLDEQLKSKTKEYDEINEKYRKEVDKYQEIKKIKKNKNFKFIIF